MSEATTGSHTNLGDYVRKTFRAPVYQVAKKTPLEEMKKLGRRLDNTVLIKREDLQPVHSFKLRGAYAMMAGLSETARAAGVVAASAGNHAQGVALAGSALNTQTIIIMPLTTPKIKVDSVTRLGGEVRMVGSNFNEAAEHARQLAENENKTLIHPFDDPDVIAGQGTVGMELVQQNADLYILFVPVGGGGLLAGVGAFIKQVVPNIRIVGVESEESACLSAALEAGRPVTLESIGQFADGVAVRRIGDETFRICRQCVDDIVTVSNDEICAAMKDIFEDTRAIAEPSGALATAGLKKYVAMNALAGKRLGTILSGANLNFHALRYVSERCDIGENSEGILAVTIPERKGSFLDFCKRLGGRSMTEFNYRYADPDHANIFVSIRLEKGEAELADIVEDLKSGGYKVVDLSGDELAKVHVRYMVGGRPQHPVDERLYSFEFPQYPGAFLKFLHILGTEWNITLFHYRSHGTDYGRVLAGFGLPDADVPRFVKHLHELGYAWRDESENPAYQSFLSHQRLRDVRYPPAAAAG